MINAHLDSDLKPVDVIVLACLHKSSRREKHRQDKKCQEDGFSHEKQQQQKKK